MTEIDHSVEAPVTAPAVTPATTAVVDADELRFNLRVMHFAYGLMAWGVIGLFDQATVPTIFAIGSITLPLIVSAILVYMKRADAAPFWFASHTRYLIITFWLTVLFQILSFSFNLNALTFSTALIGALWSIYRVIRGWLTLTQNKPIST